MRITSAGVWMIFLGYGCESSCMIPIGRQWASGLSLLLSATRFFTRSEAHGWYGAPPSVCEPTFPNGLPRPGVGAPLPRLAFAPAPVAPPAAPPPAPRPRPAAGGLRPSMTGGTHPRHGAVSHTPDRSGFPSAGSGARALRTYFPSGVPRAPSLG